MCICICTYTYVYAHMHVLYGEVEMVWESVYIYISCMIIRVYIYNIHCTKDEIEWIGRVRFSV